MIEFIGIATVFLENLDGIEKSIPFEIPFIELKKFERWICNSLFSSTCIPSFFCITIN